jgi:hypothetical protein
MQPGPDVPGTLLTEPATPRLGLSRLLRLVIPREAEHEQTAAEDSEKVTAVDIEKRAG